MQRTALALCLGLILSPLGWAQALVIEYRDKPPYSHTEQGKPAGFLIKKTQDILRLAGIEATYAEVPVRRIVNNIQANQYALCSPGWYRLPEREAFAQFSLPIHRDKPHIVLANAQAAMAIRQHGKLSSLFADASLTAGVLEGVSYGPELDRALANLPRPPESAKQTPIQLARMVNARRADYMLIDQEDAAWMTANEGLNALDLVRFEFPDMPEGMQRHLFCSKLVDANTLDRINAAIKKLNPEPAPRR